MRGRATEEVRGDDWAGRPEQRGEHLNAIEVALLGRAQDTGEHLLRRGAMGGSIAAAIDLASNHRGTDRLFGAPVKCRVFCNAELNGGSATSTLSVGRRPGACGRVYSA